jgi:DNA-binding beta-propeller fold protein YncE
MLCSPLVARPRVRHMRGRPWRAGTWDDLRLVGLKLIFLIATRAVSDPVQRQLQLQRPMGIAVDGTQVWVTNYGHPGIGHSVTELNASNGSLVRTLYGFKYPSSVAVEGSHVWVANHGGNSVTEFPAE